jgi:hypothetical protein
VSELGSVEELFRGRHFDREVMILCVRWHPALWLLAIPGKPKTEFCPTRR